jgi:2-amino-4-hydroxy-6-hydroxymethyldihydropteridine diphosphokinase
MGVAILYKIKNMKPVIHNVCILLGSNIEPEQNIPRAVELLQEKLTLLKASSIWESASVDCCYPNYLNLALRVATALDACDLKEMVLRPLEARMGRVRTEDKNAPRPIDLDIILFDRVVLDPTLWQHAYVAVPISEIFPNYRAETGETLKMIAGRLAKTTPVKLRKDVSIVVLSRN